MLLLASTLERANMMFVDDDDTIDVLKAYSLPSVDVRIANVRIGPLPLSTPKELFSIQYAVVGTGHATQLIHYRFGDTPLWCIERSSLTQYRRQEYITVNRPSHPLLPAMNVLIDPHLAFSSSLIDAFRIIHRIAHNFPGTGQSSKALPKPTGCVATRRVFRASSPQGNFQGQCPL